LYTSLASEERLRPGAVGLVDERFGKKLHPKSNEKMIQDTGLLRYFEILDIPFYPIIKGSLTRVEAAEQYDRDYRRLNSFFARHVGILGIGADGHISSIIPNRPDFKNPIFEKIQKNLLISEFDDPNSAYGQRIGMTFLGLSMLDVLFVLVFGPEKKNALIELFNEGSEELIPARFFKRPEIARKTLFITDQTI
jgi:6-phosphogluconolactonase/glucosamine-6-phosphate isomerase/deaminase